MDSSQTYHGLDNSEEDFSTIHLDEVKKMLGYSGRGYRSVLVWCQKKHVTVIGLNRRRRILRSEWVRVNKEEITKTIKREFPNNWQKIIKQKVIEELENSTIYIPKSQLSENFLKDLFDE
jgi:hypothetical protein